MKILNWVIYILFFMGWPLAISAQTKFEREYRIKENDVPEQALRFINDAVDGGKVKWYAEESQDGKSIEAKVKFDKQKFSVEFDTLGNLQDVEKTIKFQDLDQNTGELISRSLTAKFGDYIILKVQIQYTAKDPGILQVLIRNGTSEGTYQEKYEIVVETREDKAYKAYEVLIGQNGEIEKTLELDLRSMNNMEF